MILEFIYSIFAGIGFAIFFYYAVKIFFDLMYILIFTLGYLILHVLNFNWQKIKKNPYGTCISILNIIKSGVLDSLDSPTELRLGAWSWRPLFKFKREKMPDKNVAIAFLQDMKANDATLSQSDGFANLPDDLVSPVEK